MNIHRTALVGLALWATLPADAAEAPPLPIALEDHFGIFLVTKEKRSPQDRVAVTGGSAEISYWRSLEKRDPTEEICNAYTWLLTGRGAYGQGAAEAFQKFPSLSQIQLHFFDVETGTRVGKKKAEILPTSRVIPYLKIGVERRSLLSKRVESKKLREQLGKGNCAELGAKYLDSRWFDEAFLRQGKSGK